MTPISRVPMRIRALRRQRGLTQAVLANKSGLSREYLGRLEAGWYDPKLSVLQRIAKALQVSIVDLLN
jgi:transcriptional regulator with XRE-family HTH domain